jgi:rhodanese-related sulfurtransferase
VFRPHFTFFPVWVLAGIAALFPADARAQSDFDRKLQSLYRHTVPVIRPVVLAAEIRNGKNWLLLDCREPGEYRVSHLEGALNPGYNSFDWGALSSIPKDHPIVVYCSVGYRSERIGEQLQKAGYTRVYNLYGGIFEWVNAGYPVYAAENRPTGRVHAYSRSWGKWLQKGEKVYE